MDCIISAPCSHFCIILSAILLYVEVVERKDIGSTESGHNISFSSTAIDSRLSWGIGENSSINEPVGIMDYRNYYNYWKRYLCH